MGLRPRRVQTTSRTKKSLKTRTGTRTSKVEGAVKMKRKAMLRVYIRVVD